ncbi:hypothetical protein CROQUDRAFT_662016, partial [Cronartium quercuum f. sp. fusiforme G11]
ILLPSSQALHSTDGPTHHHHPQKDAVSVEGVVEVYLRQALGVCTTSVENFTKVTLVGV